MQAPTMSSNVNNTLYGRGEEKEDIEAGTPNPTIPDAVTTSGPGKGGPTWDDENTQESGDSANMASQVRAQKFTLPKKTFLFCGLIIALGCAASAAFVSVGITGARTEQDKQFESRSAEVVKFISSTWNSYEFVALHTHNVCRKGVTRQEFKELYEYLNSTGLVFGSTTWLPNVTHEERPILEEEARAFYAEFYPEVTYRGFTGLEFDPANPLGFAPGLRSNQSHYFPGHYVEPVLENVGQIDYDIFSGPQVLTRGSVELALSTWKPALTPRIRIARDRASAAIDSGEVAFSVILLHPGVPLSTMPDSQASDLAGIVVRIPDFLVDLSTRMVESAEVFLYDSTNPDNVPLFLGGASMFVNGDGDVISENEPVVELSELLSSATTKTYTSVIDIAQRKWTVAIVAVEGSYKADTLFIILGGVIIGGCCVLLALWLYTTMRRQARMTRIEALSAAEKSDIMVESARNLAKSERELNDFIAHEVRNPLSAALSACSFVAAALSDVTKSLLGLEERKSVLDDVHIIDSSLHFINDLLRNMLDVQRAASNQLSINLAPTDILSDVVMPVDAMLYRRGTPFKVELLCPKNLIVSTDRLRLKQIILNLGRNSVKFLQKGFVRLRVVEIQGSVHIYVEDSGPGIPPEKRSQLFAKFQESLDVLNQGTGIGLSLSKKLAELIGAELWFDETYDSGIDGCPGARFVVNLKKPSLRLEDKQLNMANARIPSRALTNDHSGAASDRIETVDEIRSPQLAMKEHGEQILPDTLSVMFVDDDFVLRKLFIRAVKKVAPEWHVQEAANGETALRMIDDRGQFDLIFMDQYMASVEKQLLGTEATRALRSRGVTSKICGLSANDTEEQFLDAGANAFMMKPFPCDKTGLTRELLRVLYDSIEVEGKEEAQG